MKMQVLLTTLHAKYSHASLALPCIAACCSDLNDVDVAICELTVNEQHHALLRHIMSYRADVVAFSCYIWNIEQTLKLAADIKQICADTRIVLGGPEASFGVFELMHEHPAVDFVIKGEGELVFRKLLEQLHAVKQSPERIEISDRSLGTIENLFFRDGVDITSGPLCKKPLELDQIPSPFKAGLVDLSRPLTYYETSRGCPFSCAFCLSSVEGAVRSFSIPRIESDLRWLMGHNTSQIKLVDRTFNFDSRRANHIWWFILENNQSSRFHFEIAADLLTDDNLALLSRVPAGVFHFEIGIQSASQETLDQVTRKSNLAAICANVKRLREETAVEIHLDLVAGLPGEEYAGLMDSLQVVAELRPHMIQIEPLKVLKGAPMREIANKLGYRYSGNTPYTILATPWLSYADICRVETVGRLLDLFYNHGGFQYSLRFMQQRMTFRALFDRLAHSAHALDLSGRATRRLYELFAELCGQLLSEEERSLLYDALFFDYCSCEMPLQGRLPAFIDDRKQQCRWPKRQELAQSHDLPDDSRIRLFRFEFMQDYRGIVPDGGQSAIDFVYVSGEGRGLQVLILPAPSK